jgi:hypothetical protein
MLDGDKPEKKLMSAQSARPGHLFAAALCDGGSADAVPPDLGVFGLAEHAGQLFLNLPQTVGAQLASGLFVLVVTAIFRAQGVRVA